MTWEAPVFLYETTVVVQRYRDREPAGVREVRVVREVRAVSWAKAAECATEDVLDDLSQLMGGLAGARIVEVNVEAADSRG